MFYDFEISFLLDISLKYVIKGLIDYKSTLVQVIKVNQDPWHHIASLGHNEVRWV